MSQADWIALVGTAVAVVGAVLAGVRQIAPQLAQLKADLARNTAHTETAAKAATDAANHSADRVRLTNQLISQQVEIYRLQRLLEAIELEPGALAAVTSAKRRLDSLRLTPPGTGSEPGGSEPA